MNRQPNWDELSRTIRDEVDRAVNSQDFQNMAQNVRRAAGTAAEAGSEVLRRAARTVQPVYTAPTVQTPVRDLYGKTGGKVAATLAKLFFGSVFSLVTGVVTLVALFAGGIPGAAVSGGVLAASGLLLGSGIADLNFITRFRTYRRQLGQGHRCEIKQLARAVGKSLPFVRKDVQKMIEQGYFLQGHLDHERNNLIISDAVYQRFEQARLELAQAQQRRAEETAPAKDPRVQEVLDKGNAFIAQIRKCNDDIPGMEVSTKIDRIEQIVRRIFDRVRTNPEVIPDLKKLMDYYLPMTVKLLTAYADMDAQPVQGENILNSKREIEGTLDTLSVAFEKILDELFQDTALDISSDISVLNAMLAREGLTEDELTKMRNRQNS